jgi:hypothetical protein
MLDDTLEDERLELTDDRLLLEEELEIREDDLLDDALLEELWVLGLYLGIEHSFLPPATRVPVPKVLSLQIKPPLNSL